MAERSFAEEVGKLRLADGETFRGEGILAVTKALLQSGVSYVGGYQGAPISHLMDVLADAQGILSELGVHFEASASEAAAAAMLAASVNYPLRGAVTWKSTVGTNVASDALANVASSGVRGGALVIIGEDYGEGSSIMQERSHAFAMKSQIWLLDPRPNLPSIVAMVERGFELSEASNSPVMLELRIRACHVYGSFAAKNNVRPAFGLKDAMENPTRDYSRVVLPPSNFVHEIEKIERRWPAAVDYIRKHRLNEFLGGAKGEVGIIVQGGLYNTLMRALQRLGRADAFGETDIPIYCLNVAYPLIDDEVRGFCLDKRAVLMVEEGQPDYLEQAVNASLRRADVPTKIIGKDVFPRAGEYTGAVMMEALGRFFSDRVASGSPPAPPGGGGEGGSASVATLAAIVPQRPAGFCIGCPERPVFAAMKLVEKEIGKFHVSCDIGCHLFSILPPFDIGNTTMGYGLGWSGASAFGAPSKQRTVAVMGDGGFWHNGLASGVGNAVFNRSDNVLVIVDNGYSAATGGQDILSSRAANETKSTNNPIARAVRGVGVEWVREVNTYDIGRMKKTLKEAMTTPLKGPKVVIAQSECMLNRQRRERPLHEKAVREGKRVVRVRYGVDPDTCTGDHACIRLSGCPSLTLRDNPDPLREDPVAFVNNDCVGCGVCGENAHAAILCPSFYRAELIYNPTWADKVLATLRGAVIGLLQPRDLPAARDTEFGGAAPRSDSATRAGAPSLPPLGFAEGGRASSADATRPIKIAINALGGQGGGVLADFIVALGERAGFIAQSTSVPGVAQRTGATVYYVELFSAAEAEKRGKQPVLALMPTPGDVDIVIAAELMEAGRAMLRGFVSDRTTLIASSHRDYAIGEKIAPGDGRADGEEILRVAERRAGRALFADMAAAAEAAGAPLSAVLFGALCGSGALPISRIDFEAVIREGGRAVERNLAGFEAGLSADASPLRPSGDTPPLPPLALRAKGGSPALDAFPAQAHEFLSEGVRRCTDYQDAAYAGLYLERVRRVRDADAAAGGHKRDWRLTREVARHLALAMTYEDALRVADLKTRPSRFARFRSDVKAELGQIVHVHEYLHPRVEEICDILPGPLAAFLSTGAPRTMLKTMLGEGRRVPTTKLRGFLQLRLLAMLRVTRRASSRFRREQKRIEDWLSLVLMEAPRDYALAVELAALQRLVKGYGDTYERGMSRLSRIMGALDAVRRGPAPAPALRELREAALKDEDGRALAAALKRLETPREAVTA